MAVKAQSQKAKEAQLVAEALRRSQLDTVQTAIDRLSAWLQTAKKKEDDCAFLESHVSGFYIEIDKLTKGKTLLPATDLMVESINRIIQDAKALMDEDLYIGRLKEFVPAGDNPTYPDVLMVTRTIMSAADRARPRFTSAVKKAAAKSLDARTFKCALELFLQEPSEVVTKDEVETNVGKVGQSFWTDDDNKHNQALFDFDRLDELDLSEHLAAGS